MSGQEHTAAVCTNAAITAASLGRCAHVHDHIRTATLGRRRTGGPDGTSLSWGPPFAPATLMRTENLKSVTAAGSGTAKDNLGVTHQVAFDVEWTGIGPLEPTVNGPGSKRVQREATAAGQVTFNGNVLVNGEANHPTQPG